MNEWMWWLTFWSLLCFSTGIKHKVEVCDNSDVVTKKAFIEFLGRSDIVCLEGETVWLWWWWCAAFVHWWNKFNQEVLERKCFFSFLLNASSYFSEKAVVLYGTRFPFYNPYTINLSSHWLHLVWLRRNSDIVLHCLLFSLNQGYKNTSQRSLRFV